MNLLSFLPGILKTAAKVLGIGKLEEAAEALTAGSLSPEQKVQLELALKAHEAEMRKLDLDELKAVIGETNAMVASPDKYVARARPTGLYVAYAISIALTVALVAGVQVDAAAILTICAPLYGAQGYYMHLRTKEKING